MSIFIKGVDMPTTPKVYRCELTIYFDDGMGKYSHCHRVPPENVVFIKTPHGRLIDAETLEELFRETITVISQKTDMQGAYEHMIRASAMVVEMIKDAPTLIEAEE